MNTLRRNLLRTIRSMAQRWDRPSQMLHELISRSAPEAADQQLLVRYFSEAFCFTEGQAYTIFGWLPDGTGKLPDSTLDHLLSRRIQQTRSEWETADC